MTIYWHTLNKELVILSEYQSGAGKEIFVETKCSMLGYHTQPKYLIHVRGIMLDKLKVFYGFQSK